MKDFASLIKNRRSTRKFTTGGSHPKSRTDGSVVQTEEPVAIRSG